MNLQVKKVKYGTDEYEKFLDFRDYYFRKPQGLDIRDDDLSGDKVSEMYAWYDKEGNIQATVMYMPHKSGKAQIRGVITSNDLRGKGYGRIIMKYAEDEVKKDPKKFTGIIMDARVVAQDFYEHLGYKTISDVYDIATIPHVTMIKEF